MLQCRSCNKNLEPTFRLNEHGRRVMKYECGCNVAEPRQSFELLQQEKQDEYEQQRKVKQAKEAHAQNLQKLGPHLADLLRPKDVAATPVPYEQPKFKQKINQPALTVPKGSEIAEIGPLSPRDTARTGPGQYRVTLPGSYQFKRNGGSIEINGKFETGTSTEELVPAFFPNPAFQPGDMVVVDGKGPYTITSPDDCEIKKINHEIKKINQLLDMVDAGIISKEDVTKILKEFKP